VEETLKAFEDQEETASTSVPLVHIEDHYKGSHPGIYARNDRSLWIKDSGIRLYLEKKIPTIFSKESALIPLAIYQI
jgi:hypothetical protein